MRLIVKTPKKIIIEVHLKEVEKEGFDNIWDKIREVYKISDYKIFYIGKNKEKTLMFIELALDKEKKCEIF